jgi:glutaminase
VSVQIRVPTQTGEKRRRVASLGPGLTFGEMALFGGGARSADVIADEKVICYGLAVEELKELAAEHPNIMVTILSNLTRDFSERLRGDPDARVTRFRQRWPKLNENLEEEHRE